MLEQKEALDAPKLDRAAKHLVLRLMLSKTLMKKLLLISSPISITTILLLLTTGLIEWKK